MNQEKKELEIDSLWHYLFFDEIDARHKFRDTIHNLSDIPNMEPDDKREYIMRRIPKLQALTFVLHRLGLSDKADQLKRQWQSV